MSVGSGGPMLGGGDFFGGGGGPGLGGGGMLGPKGPYGPFAGCGCSSLFIIMAGILMVMGGCLRMLNF